MYSVRVTIWLLMRAMISSTTVSAKEKDDSNSAYASASSRGNPVFFIRALLPPGKRQPGQPEGEICFFYFTPRAARRPTCWGQEVSRGLMLKGSLYVPLWLRLLVVTSNCTGRKSPA